MPSFYESMACKSQAHCRTCRDKSVIGSVWRSHVVKSWQVDGGDDFTCPYGIPWGGRSTRIAPVSVPVLKQEIPKIEEVQEITVTRVASPRKEKVVAQEVHQPSGMVGYRGAPCVNLAESYGTEQRTCCGGRIRHVEVFRCAAGVNNGRIVKDACMTCGFYRAEEPSND